MIELSTSNFQKQVLDRQGVTLCILFRKNCQACAAVEKNLPKFSERYPDVLIGLTHKEWWPFTSGIVPFFIVYKDGEQAASFAGPLSLAALEKLVFG
jgi:hypothetical protein